MVRNGSIAAIATADRYERTSDSRVLGKVPSAAHCFNAVGRFRLEFVNGTNIEHTAAVVIHDSSQSGVHTFGNFSYDIMVVQLDKLVASVAPPSNVTGACVRTNAVATAPYLSWISLAKAALNAR